MNVLENQQLGKISSLDSQFGEILWDVEFAKDYVLGAASPFVISNTLENYAASEEGTHNLAQFLTDAKKAKLLLAHGGSVPWTFFEDKKPVMSVQEWVNRNSKRQYDVLFIQACNPFKQMPIFQGTPVLYLEGIAGNSFTSESKVLTASNRIRAIVHNIRNACKKHSYWGGEEVYSLTRKLHF